LLDVAAGWAVGSSRREDSQAMKLEFKPTVWSSWCPAVRWRTTTVRGSQRGDRETGVPAAGTSRPRRREPTQDGAPVKKTRNPFGRGAGRGRLGGGVEPGRPPVPRLGPGAIRRGGGIAVPPVVHALLCGWRARIRLHPEPPVSLCVGCGLTVPAPASPD